MEFCNLYNFKLLKSISIISVTKHKSNIGPSMNPGYLRLTG